ncbi:hypothetical protein BHE90_009508 [Fusarium euwallaceae]|uniref:Uncharacterized protein n=3 Tax=Fusarium solani species complex TaxID=232080 RepID=A0A3M2SP99_9HYPO|nr:hypothetical protein CDV36_001015 [Fusarium kuroshium]RTE76046.1 hypothetical protein BHE90_009508 [Fusarium euwallaceae]
MFSIAQDDPMVMHLIIAVAGREIEFRRHTVTGRSDQTGPEIPLRHYCKGLRLVSEALERQEGGIGDLEALCTALYLMLLYEQKFGDAHGLGLSNHLTGAAWVIKRYCKEIVSSIFGPPRIGLPPQAPALARRCQGPQDHSLFIVRLLTWIAHQDAAASTFKVGGQFNGALCQAIGEQNPATWENFERLNHFSLPLYRTMWADSYPQAEMVDDIENQHVYSLLSACGHLRYMISDLSRLHGAARERQEVAVEEAIAQVGHLYNDLLQVAGGLSMATDNSHRLVANIRGIVAYYYAIMLEFHRVSSSHLDGFRVQEVVQCIMDLAAQDYEHGGDESIVRIAWPLFVTALVTDKARHQNWVLSHLGRIRRFGKNYDRAYEFLGNIIKGQQGPPGKLSELNEPWEEIFVI